ncbi:MAG: carbohydrate-binding domain-containing protein, partial [Clostridium sp.]
MNKKSIYFKLLAVLLCTTILSSCDNKAALADKTEVTGTTIMTSISDWVTYDANDYYTEWKNETPNYIKLNDTGATLEGTGATVVDSKITITTAGIYVISGKLNDGQIIVDIEDKGTVKLVLNGAEVNCSNSSPLYIKSAKKTIISLEAGTENIISDGKKYVSTDDRNAAIFSQDDLTINGTGNLTVRGNYNDGITSKDDLKITGGNITIYSTDDGLVGKDLVAV